MKIDVKEIAFKNYIICYYYPEYPFSGINHQVIERYLLPSFGSSDTSLSTEVNDLGSGTDLSLLIPIMMVVVIELSSIAREITIQDVISEGRSQLGYLIERNIGFLSWTDQSLGRFAFIHNSNCVLMWYLLILVMYFSSDERAGVLAGFLFMLWAILPVLEINEYNIILDEKDYPLSMYYHFFSTLALFAVLSVFKIHVRSQIPSERPVLIPYLIISILVVMAQSFGFLWLLVRDFQPVIESSS